MKIFFTTGLFFFLLVAAMGQSAVVPVKVSDRLSFYVQYTPMLTFRKLKDVAQTPLSSSIIASRNKLDVAGLGFAVGAGIGWSLSDRWLADVSLNYQKLGHRQRLYYSTPVEISFGAPEKSRFIQRYYYYSLPIAVRHLIPGRNYTLAVGGGISFDVFHRESRYGRLKYANGKRTLMHFDSRETTQRVNTSLIISAGLIYPLTETVTVGLLPVYSFQLLSMQRDDIREWLRGGGIQTSLRVKI